MRLPSRPATVASLGLLSAALLGAACSRDTPKETASIERRANVPASPRVVGFGQPHSQGRRHLQGWRPLSGRWPVAHPARSAGLRPLRHRLLLRRTTSTADAPPTARSSTCGRCRPRIRPCRCPPTSTSPTSRTAAPCCCGSTTAAPTSTTGVIDVSRAAARYLGFENRGTARVRVRYAGRAPLSGDDRHEQRFLASQPWFRVALSHPPAYRQSLKGGGSVDLNGPANRYSRWILGSATAGSIRCLHSPSLSPRRALLCGLVAAAAALVLLSSVARPAQEKSSGDITVKAPQALLDGRRVGRRHVPAQRRRADVPRQHEQAHDCWRSCSRR